VTLVGERMTIGTNADNDIVLAEDSAILPYHASLERVGNRWTILERESTSGVLVNRAPIFGQHLLWDEDQILIGRTRLSFLHHPRAQEVGLATTDIAVSLDNHVERWRIDRTTLVGRGYRLSLIAPDGRQWSEPMGLRACCNCARVDAWASGMQRDMAGGLAVYLLDGVPPDERPPQVATLDPAPADTVVTVDEQRAWYRAWLDSRSA
jgi:hypothetical protein